MLWTFEYPITLVDSTLINLFSRMLKFSNNFFNEGKYLILNNINFLR